MVRIRNKYEHCASCFCISFLGEDGGGCSFCKIFESFLCKDMFDFNGYIFLFCRTPFHADVFRSYSWSANICGKKRWLFYPPGAEDHLRDTLGNLAYDVTSPEIDDLTKYPHRRKAGEPLEVIQEAGQVIFVPSGWHHQVFNLVSTLLLIYFKKIKNTI